MSNRRPKKGSSVNRQPLSPEPPSGGSRRRGEKRKWLTPKNAIALVAALASFLGPILGYLSGPGSSQSNSGNGVNQYMIKDSQVTIAAPDFTPPPEVVIHPQDLEDYQHRISYAADCILDGEYAAGERFLSECLSMEGLSPEKSSTFYYDRGLCHFYLDSYNQAAADFTAAAEHGNFHRAYYSLGCTYSTGLKEYAQAVTAFDQAIAMASQPPANYYTARADALERLGERSRAAADYAQATQLDPEDPLPLEALDRLGVQA